MPGGTFRENLLRQPGQKHLRSDYYGGKFNFKDEEETPNKQLGALAMDATAHEKDMEAGR